MTTKKRTIAITLLVLSFACYIPGIFLPMFSNTRFFFFTKKFSLLSSIGHLFEAEEIFLAIIVLVFSILLPLFKYFILIESIFGLASEKMLKISGFLSKWAMLDVFVMALAIVFYKFSFGLVKFSFETGAYFFIASILLSMVVSVLHRLPSNRSI